MLPRAKDFVSAFFTHRWGTQTLFLTPEPGATNFHYLIFSLLIFVTIHLVADRNR